MQVHQSAVAQRPQTLCARTPIIIDSFDYSDFWGHGVRTNRAGRFFLLRPNSRTVQIVGFTLDKKAQFYSDTRGDITNANVSLSNPRSLRPTMHFRMTSRAQRDEVQLRIVSGVAAKLSVMNLQVRHGTARLTSPAIAP